MNNFLKCCVESLAQCKLWLELNVLHVERFGQRALVGKVNMDMESPDYYVEKTETSIQETRRYLQDWLLYSIRFLMHRGFLMLRGLLCRNSLNRAHISKL